MTNVVDNEELKNKLATKEMEKAELPTTAAPSASITPYRKIEATLKQMMPTLTEAMPRVGLTAERLTRVALTTIRNNPSLLEADFTSLISCIMQSAQLGLEPSILGHVHLIPYRDNKKGITNVQFQIGYKGLLELVHRSGNVQTIKCNVVCENDEFDYSFGIDEKLYHKPSKSNRGNPIFYYAYAKLSSGGHAYEVMSVEDIQKIRDAHSVSYKFQKNSSPWVAHFDAMAKKTVLKQLIKYLPISVNVQSQVATDETIIPNMKEERIPVDIFEGEIVE